MATIIRLNSKKCEPFSPWRYFDPAIRPIYTGLSNQDGVSYLRPVIAKGNIIEGIEAKY